MYKPPRAARYGSPVHAAAIELFGAARGIIFFLFLSFVPRGLAFLSRYVKCARGLDVGFSLLLEVLLDFGRARGIFAARLVAGELNARARAV